MKKKNNNFKPLVPVNGDEENVMEGNQVGTGDGNCL
jgi:hypothetical protein